ncbi:hypothetical protein TD95_003221 [Thielaviopsis punctulata]|uniref:MHYT domain-containing protein n=1 Tax=Thielaviopsis punctulata TaxID=72032 RepID=A0A0F4ZF03_9PEZI|nr:hypothetical protein TD95_003221 [Thielaviopsis punctulata]
MDTTDTNMDLFNQWQGKIVPRAFNPGIVTLSYCVSFIGALSTLELINRRTSPKGVGNHAAVTMGGISIWSMHYLGNRAIEILDGQSQLQIAYSSGFTALSFFVPILVLVPAFVSAGSNKAVSWWRVTIGGSLAGAAVCGMHYLGNNSISNYLCEYSLPNVVGSAIIALVASNVALATFFVFRAAWTQSWWKRVICAIVLAGGVSGMHWVASTGTQYRLVKMTSMDNALSRNVTAIMIICLSIGACLIIASSSIYTARIVRRYATKAKQVTLAAAVFDKHGRILVTPDGLLPLEKITDSFPERSPSDTLTEAHPLFHWMFQATRNWSVLEPLARSTVAHLMALPKNNYDTIDGELKLVDSHGEVIERYDVVFKEMFTAAAYALAEKLKSPMSSLGVLWDHILATGSQGYSGLHRMDLGDEEKVSVRRTSGGHGSLMFVVRVVNNDREAENLQAAGYRFAEPHQVSGYIASSLRLKANEMETHIRSMSRYSRDPHGLIPGVHLGIFGVRARVQSQGFEVLVRSSARNMLPSVMLPLERLDAEQLEFLSRFDRTNTKSMLRMLENATGAKLTPHQKAFSNMLVDALTSLRTQVESGVFDEAMLICKPAELPCNTGAPASPAIRLATANTSDSEVPLPSQTCQMICLRAVIPIHLNATTKAVEFVPLNFFKVHQLMFAGSAYHLAFSRGVHRDIAPVVNTAAAFAVLHTGHPRKTSTSRRGLALFSRRSPSAAVDADGNPVPTSLSRSKSNGAASNRSSSTLKLWPGRHSMEQGAHSADEIDTVAGLGGIMVSQEVTVQVLNDDKVEHTTVPQSPSGWEHVPGIPLIGEASVPIVQHDQTGEIELKPMEHVGGHGGTNVVSSRGDKLGDVRTYVDDLFAICLSQR